jgi:hypothetical protein
MPGKKLGGYFIQNLLATSYIAGKMVYSWTTTYKCVFSFVIWQRMFAYIYIYMYKASVWNKHQIIPEFVILAQ